MTQPSGDDAFGAASGPRSVVLKTVHRVTSHPRLGSPMCACKTTQSVAFISRFSLRSLPPARFEFCLRLHDAPCRDCILNFVGCSSPIAGIPSRPPQIYRTNLRLLAGHPARHPSPRRRPEYPQPGSLVIVPRWSKYQQSPSIRRPGVTSLPPMRPSLQFAS